MKSVDSVTPASDEVSASPADAAAISSEAPASFPLRLASTFAWIVGLVTMLGASALYGPGADNSGASDAALVFGLFIGATVCAAGYLVRRRKKLGAYLVVGAYVVPTALILATTGDFRPPALLLVLATITLLANWKQLR